MEGYSYRPSLDNPVRTRLQLLELGVEAERERIALAHQVSAIAPKVALIERIMASPDSLTFTQASKIMGVPLRLLTAWMYKHGWVYRQNASWVAYKKRIDSGDLEYKEAHYTDAKIGLPGVKAYCHITQKGMIRLAQQMEQEAA